MNSQVRFLGLFDFESQTQWASEKNFIQGDSRNFTKLNMTFYILRLVLIFSKKFDTCKIQRF